MQAQDNQWFFRLVERCGTTPAERLVGVFGVVEHLIQAPEFRNRIVSEFPAGLNCLYSSEDLNGFFAEAAEAAGMAEPNALARQLNILLHGAIAEELRNPRSGALRQAAAVAQVVVANSGPQKAGHSLARNVGWAAVGGAAAMLLAVVIGLPALHTASVSANVVAQAGRPVQAVVPVGVSPDEIDAALALHEKIERGICRAPHLLVLPPGQVTAYMNAIEARTPEDPVADGRNLRAFLAWYDTIKSTECYDPPMNGHTAVKWSKS